MESSAISATQSAKQLYNDEDEDSLAALASNWASNTGMHGMPNITRSDSKLQKMLWTLLLLGGFAAMTWQIQVIVERYTSYPTQRDDSDQLVMPRLFPAVTICNQSPAKQSSVKLSLSAGTGNFDPTAVGGYQDGGDRKPMDKVLNGMYPSEFNTESASKDPTRQQNAISDAAGLNYIFLDYYNSLSPDGRRKVGYSIDEMLIDCSFGGVCCDKHNFTAYLHPMYGNCYTFNAASANATPVRVARSGPLYGLSLLLFINQAEYIGSVAQSAGAIVTVHEPNKQPFPEDNGITTMPGTETQIGLTETRFSRLAAPYVDDCQADFAVANSQLNMFAGMTDFALPNLNYSMQACMKTCTQLATERACNCSAPRIPASAGTQQRRSNATAAVSVCPFNFNLQNKTLSQSAICAQQVAHDSFDYCRSVCKQECDESLYDTAMAMSQWPSLSHECDAQYLLSASGETFRRNLDASVSEEQKRLYVSRNLAKLVIFIRSQVVHRHLSFPAYGIDAALSDTGGQVGLWLGLSVLTVCEILEVFAKIFFLVAATAKRRARLTQRRCLQWSTTAGQVLGSLKHRASTKDSYNIGCPGNE